MFNREVEEKREDSIVAVAKRETERFKVYVLNDDTTTMDCVVESLRQGFKLSKSRAIGIMMEAHKNGRSLVGEYYYNIAVHRILVARAVAERYGFDLKFAIE